MVLMRHYVPGYPALVLKPRRDSVPVDNVESNFFESPMEIFYPLVRRLVIVVV